MLNKVLEIKYSDSIAWLFKQLPMYQRMGKAAYKADLSNTLKLTDYLNNPERSFKSVHVAGTNGKGSTSHMLASVLQEAGYKVGLYTSPHLKDFRERIKINGEMIPKRSVSSFVNKHQSFFIESNLSFFEMTVGLAFDYFRKEKVDIAIIEVGLGGRLDSTNIITPEVSIITNIGLDHTQFLGDTLESIATEKAGIIKSGIPVIIGHTTSETKLVFEKIASVNRAPIIFSEELSMPQYDLDLKGQYQSKNAKVSAIALKQLRKVGWEVSDNNIIAGLGNVIGNTGLLGRWQTLRESPKVICDTAHNKEGLELVITQLLGEVYKELHIVLGVVSEKDLSKILPLFPKNAKYYFCAPEIARALPAKTLMKTAAQFDLKGESYKSVKEAYKLALKYAGKGDLIYVGGSTFVVAEVL